MMGIMNRKDLRTLKNVTNHPKVGVLCEDRAAILISLHPKHLEKIMLGVKKLEFRRRWTKSDARKLVIYATAPIQSITMIADIKKVHYCSIAELCNLSDEIGGGLTRDDLLEYFKNCEHGYAIEFENIQQLIPQVHPKSIISTFTAPQSFMFLDRLHVEKLNEAINRNPSLIFVSGAHGVGKSNLCHKASVALGIRSFSASALIKSFPQDDKRTLAIADNQEILLKSLKKTKTIRAPLILDGHFALIDSDNNVVRIPMQTFLDIAPTQIILVIDSPEAIFQRNRNRGINHLHIELIKKLQEEEIAYAQQIANKLEIPLASVKSGNDMDFLETISKFIFNQG